MLRYRYLTDKFINWVDLDFIRELRSHPLNKNLFFQLRNHITRVEQEWWFHEEYSKTNKNKIWVVYDDEKGEPVGYVQMKIDSYIHGRLDVRVVCDVMNKNKNYEKEMLTWCEMNISKMKMSNIYALYYKILFGDNYYQNILVDCGFVKYSTLNMFIDHCGERKSVVIFIKKKYS